MIFSALSFQEYFTFTGCVNSLSLKYFIVAGKMWISHQFYPCSNTSDASVNSKRSYSFPKSEKIRMIFNLLISHTNVVGFCGPFLI